MEHPPPAAAYLLTVDDGYAVCRCLHVDGIDAALPLDVGGVDAQLQIAELGEMVVGFLSDKLLAGNFDVQALTIQRGTGHGVDVTQNGVGTIAVAVLIVRTDAAQTQTVTNGRGRNNDALDGFV